MSCVQMLSAALRELQMELPQDKPTMFDLRMLLVDTFHTPEALAKARADAKLEHETNQAALERAKAAHQVWG